MNFQLLSVWEKDQKPLESLTVKEGINLVGIIILAILVVILMAILSYLIYKIHQLKSLQASKSKESNDSKHVYEIPVTNDQNYKQVENEQSKYTAVKKPGERDDDDHVYSHLNEVDKGYVNQKKNWNLNNFVFMNIVIPCSSLISMF